MWRKSNGFTFVEILSTMIIWMIITTTLLPILVRVNQERNSLILAQEARYLLVNEYERVRMDETAFAEKEIEKKGKIFKLIKISDRTIPSLCIVYRDDRGTERKRCVYWNEN